MPHTHKSTSYRVRGYSHSANPGNENPCAHGDREYTYICECGHEQIANVNGGHREEGPWLPPPPDTTEQDFFDATVKEIYELARRRLRLNPPNWWDLYFDNRTESYGRSEAGAKQYAEDLLSRWEGTAYDEALARLITEIKKSI
jgi:hypothetical protein